MAVGKEILTKIRSVQNTQKITKAMQMVSTSKMRKTQERMRLARPYAEKVRQVMGHLAQTNEYHGIQLLEERKEVKRAGFILITTDKGLCGGLNANVLKRFFAQVQDYQERGIAVDVVCFGSKGLAACQRIGLNVIASVSNLGDTPKMEILLGALTEIFGRYPFGFLLLCQYDETGTPFRSTAADWFRCSGCGRRTEIPLGLPLRAQPNRCVGVSAQTLP